jgi:hypothetical protein
MRRQGLDYERKKEGWKEARLKMKGTVSTSNFSGFSSKINNVIWITNEPEDESHKYVVLLISYTSGSINHITKIFK